MTAENWDAVRPEVYWLTDPDRPDPLPPLVGTAEADLVVVGGGYTGLWTALRARERWPERSVLLVESGVCGSAASGRNGGFVDPSLTHGFGNGLDRWPDELETLDRLGAANLADLEATIRKYGIDCDWQVPGELNVARTDAIAADLREHYEARRDRGDDVTWLDRDEVRQHVDSPAYVAGLIAPEVAQVEPARLAWGLRQACLDAGVVIREGTRVTDLETDGAAMRVVTDSSLGAGMIRAGQVALGTNAFPPLLRRLKHYVVPVYDFVLMTAPMTPEQRVRLGWRDRIGLAEANEQFVYARLTRDHRILWGGIDAVYHFGGRTGPQQEAELRTPQRLAERFRATFPQLDDLPFEFRWSGVIDTCTRFAPFFGLTHGGKVSYAVGYTGLGVGATRFGADVMLDLLAGEDTERTRLRMVKEKPVPFPPEPARWVGISLTRWSMARADATGRRNLWLRALDKVGLGFDS